MTNNREKEWGLFRLDDNGNRFLVDSYPTRQQAECERNVFESKGHKQTYLVDKTDKEAVQDSGTEAIEAIRNRRSIRKFSDRPVPDGLLRQILEGARWAPSWGNTQCWEIIIVKNRDIKTKLQGTVSDRNPATNAMVQAPLVIAVCGVVRKAGYYQGQASTRFGDWLMFDLGIVTQNIALAAHSLGLGSVVVGAFDHDRAEEILDLPHGYEVVALLPVGFPAHSPPAPSRRETDHFTHFDRFGNRNTSRQTRSGEDNHE